MWTIVSLSKLCEVLKGYADELKSYCPNEIVSSTCKFTSIVGNTPDEVMNFYDWINSSVKTNDDLLAQLVKINGYLEIYLDGIPSRK